MPDCVAGEQRPTVSALGRGARPPSWFGAHRKVGSGVIDPLRQLPVPTPTHPPPRAGRRLDDRPDPDGRPAGLRRVHDHPRQRRRQRRLRHARSERDLLDPRDRGHRSGRRRRTARWYGTISGARWINTTGSTGIDQSTSLSTDYSTRSACPAGFAAPSITVQLLADNAGHRPPQRRPDRPAAADRQRRRISTRLDVHQRRPRELPRRVEHAHDQERRLRQHRTASTSRPS